MASVFAHSVDRATMRGVLRGYRHTEERLLSPRGRIDIVEQIRRPGLVSPIACRFDEYTSDVFANRALVAAVDRLLRVPGLPPRVRTSLGRLLQRFDDVQHVTVDPSADRSVDSDSNRPALRSSRCGLPSVILAQPHAGARNRSLPLRRPSWST